MARAVALNRNDRPSVQVLVSPKRQIECWRIARARHVETFDAVEDAVDFRIFPELVDRNQRVREEGDTAYVADETLCPCTVAISHKDGHVPYALDPSRFAIDAGHGVIALASVDEIRFDWMAMPRAAAVNDSPTDQGLELVRCCGRGGSGVRLRLAAAPEHGSAVFAELNALEHGRVRFEGVRGMRIGDSVVVDPRRIFRRWPPEGDVVDDYPPPSRYIRPPALARGAQQRR